jgi:hypothetical protein
MSLDCSAAQERIVAATGKRTGRRPEANPGRARDESAELTPPTSSESGLTGAALSPAQVAYALVDVERQCVGCSWRAEWTEAANESAYPRSLLRWPPIPTSAVCRACRRLLEVGRNKWLHPAEVQRLEIISQLRTVGVCSYCDPVLFSALRHRHWRLLRLSLGRGALPTPEDLRLEPVTPPSVAAESILSAAERLAGSEREGAAGIQVPELENPPMREPLLVSKSERLQQLNKYRSSSVILPNGTSQTPRTEYPLVASKSAPEALASHPDTYALSKRLQHYDISDCMDALRCKAPGAGYQSAESLASSPRSVRQLERAECACGDRATRSLLPALHVALSRYGAEELRERLRDANLPDHLLRETQSWTNCLQFHATITPSSQIYVSSACMKCFTLMCHALHIDDESLLSLPNEVLKRANVQRLPPITELEPRGSAECVPSNHRHESCMPGPVMEDGKLAAVPALYLPGLPTLPTSMLTSESAARQNTAGKQTERGSPLVIRMFCGDVHKSYRIWSNRPLQRMFRRFLSTELGLDPEQTAARYRRWDARYLHRSPPVLAGATRHPHCREVFAWDTPASLQLQNHDLIQCELLDVAPQSAVGAERSRE